ncbi:NAD-dependent epimerase/dehydratase family protein [Candidatus Pelagibacter sp.]|nr:NAD-dependent epimerase/dehydratase family protein [Candidatus Pelagibacter sp.]
MQVITGVIGLLKIDSFEMYKNSSLTLNNTIKQAFTKIDSEFGKILTVVDKKNSLIGVLTAGDLRRGILAGFNLNDKIKKIYSNDFSFVYLHELKTKKFLNSKFDTKNLSDSIYQIPVVNKKKQVVNIFSLEKLIDTLGKDSKKIQFTKINYPKVLVVGGAGYIGANLCLKLLKKKYQVLAVDKLLYDKTVIKKYLNKYKKFEFIKGDICDLNVQINVIKNVDAVVFLAEIVGDPACNAIPEDALKTNYLSISSMANLCSHLNITRFIYTSSCSVYGVNKKNDLLDEKSNLNPLSHYARMKIMSEKALLNFPSNNFKPTIFRLGTVFGPSLRNRFDLVVNTMAKSAHYNKEIIVNGGEQWRPNIHVDDVVDGIITALQKSPKKIGGKIFNLSSDRANYQIKDLAYEAKKVFKKSKVKIIKSLIDGRNYRASSKLFYKTTGFKAIKSISQANKDFKKMFSKDRKFNANNKIYNNFEIINDTKKN